jgi:putative DNA primase/helicase
MISNETPNGYGGNGRLLPQHLADLRHSGLSDATITACGFRSLEAPASVQDVLRWKRYRGELGPCLCIPFADAEGKPTGYSRLKPDRPRKSKEDGKPVKYESPKGSTNRAYFPPGTLPALKDPSAPLLITEGEKKAAKADQEGFPCIGLAGVYAWQRKRLRDKDGKATGERQLIDSLASLSWQGRPAFLCFDSDAATNSNVRMAEWHFAEALARQGATVKIVRLPASESAPDGTPAKVGLDDYLVAHGPGPFRELLTAAVNPTPPVAVAPIEGADDPHRLARLFLAEKCQHAESCTLKFWRDEWPRWDGIAYRLIPEKELRAEVTEVVKREMDRLNLIAQKIAAAKGEPPPTVRKVTGRMITDVAHALASLTVFPGRTEAPTWIGPPGNWPAGEILACRNGLVHLPSLVARREYIRPPTPRFFSPNALDFDFTLDAPAPSTWLSFLNQVWPDDPQSIDTLQDWFGYSLTSDTRQQKMLLLVGPKRSGKGTIARVHRGLVGADNVACPTLSGLGTTFGLWPLIGKTLAMIQDARLSGRTDTAAVAERLLSISGEDAQTVDRKFLSPVTVKLTSRFMLLTNELPKLNDSSGALPGRMILLQLTRSWYGKEDTALTDRLLAQLPGILLWAIAGWQRLRDRGHFIQPDAGKAMIGELTDLASPVGAFVRERCHIGPGFQVERALLFEAWKRWCEEQGREHAGDSATFGRNLRAAVPSLGDAQPRTDAGERVRVYEGIRLK